ncbi:PTS transporter subunit EIIB [Psychromonas sp. MME2]|uniref:PTS transporter subunit EIIB n=1 Tax=Psychromonas sp. MME2 TaxID=3231033 RepID=UPI00339BBDD9
MKDTTSVDKAQLKALGAKGVIIIDRVAQAIFGINSDKYRQDMTNWIDTNVDLAKDLVTAFGGKNNIQELDACLTRLRVKVNNVKVIDELQLKKLGAVGVVYAQDHSIHAIFGSKSDNLKMAMNRYLNL